MKTSNIIILSSIGFVLFLNIWLMVEIKNQFKELFTTNEKTKSEQVSIKAFKTVVIQGNARVYLNSEEENSYEKFEGKNYEITQSNDTLFIKGDQKIRIKFTGVSNIVLEDQAKLTIKSYQSDYINIKIKDDARLIIKELETYKTDLYSLNESHIKIQSSKIDTLNILSKDDAKINLDGTFNVVRGEINNESRLYVTGASNTQFSKGEKAYIRMF